MYLGILPSIFEALPNRAGGYGFVLCRERLQQAKERSGVARIALEVGAIISRDAAIGKLDAGARQPMPGAAKL